MESNGKFTLIVFNTCTREYEEVMVTEEVYTSEKELLLTCSLKTKYPNIRLSEYFPDGAFEKSKRRWRMRQDHL